MVWKIATDSSCDLNLKSIHDSGQVIDFLFAPFTVTVGGMDYVDDGNVSIENLLCEMEKNVDAARTSCPSPYSWISSILGDANVIMITISKELSGSYNSACVAKEMLLEKNPDRNVAVINSHSAGPGLANILEKISEAILKGNSFEQVVGVGNDVACKQHTLFALSSFDNLIKNGRMNKTVGLIARKLNFWGIGEATKEGNISIINKVRGQKKALVTIVNKIQEDISDIKIIHISHCNNLEMANEIKARVEKIFTSITVEIEQTKALCSFYAENHGVIISYF